QENEKSLGALQDQVASLRSLHEAVLARSGEISQLQREAEEQTRAARQDLSSLTDEMKKTVERFDFESRGLESASQRVADLRGALEQVRIAHEEIARYREHQTETRAWLSSVEQSLRELRDRAGELDQLAPTIEVVQKQAQRLNETTTAIETRREFIDDLQRR